ncbi:hypothetical protein RUM43_007939 [Polyplax serrata]|uniref:Uncharacterized protein n=1 Tax=Polyplax serrata TaxID=468196 RepID=A0AAN8PN56_POLSC
MEKKVDHLNICCRLVRTCAQEKQLKRIPEFTWQIPRSLDRTPPLNFFARVQSQARRSFMTNTMEMKGCHAKCWSMKREDGDLSDVAVYSKATGSKILS